MGPRCPRAPRATRPAMLRPLAGSEPHARPHMTGARAPRARPHPRAPRHEPRPRPRCALWPAPSHGPTPRAHATRPRHAPTPRAWRGQYNRTYVRSIGRRQCSRGDPAEIGWSACGRPFLSTDCPRSLLRRSTGRPAYPERNCVRNLDVVVAVGEIPLDVVFWGLTPVQRQAYIPSVERPAGRALRPQ